MSVAEPSHPIGDYPVGVSDPAADSTPEGWQERALHRTRPRARKRAVARGSQFLATAIELMGETGGVDFTVQALVDRSGLSLRSFYQHFGGKDELLLALYEELMKDFVAELRGEVMRSRDPISRLKRFCVTFMDRSDRVHTGGGRALTVYHLGLAADRPADFKKALEPELALLRELVEAAVAAEVVRADLSPAQITELLSSTLMSIAQIGMFGISAAGSELSPEEVWAWCHGAIVPPPESRMVRRRKISRGTLT
jgi:AcrR family transcriptional regulator